MTSLYNRYARSKKVTGQQAVVVKYRKGNPSLKRQLEKKLDLKFSLYIRLRDTDENGYFQCPTCGKFKPWKSADCSHYWSRSHKATRWDEDNCCVECSYCNRYDSSHLDGLGKHLKKKLGEQGFDLLNWKHNQVCKMTEFELAQLIKEYEKKIIQLQREKNPGYNKK